jgi:hypothetical protein
VYVHNTDKYYEHFHLLFLAFSTTNRRQFKKKDAF